MDQRCHWPPDSVSLAMQGLLWVQAGGQAGPGGRWVIISASVHSNHISLCQTERRFHLSAESLLSFCSDQKQISMIKPGSRSFRDFRLY